MIIKSLFISLFVIKFLMYLPMVFTTLEIIKKHQHTHTKYMTRLIIQQLVDIQKKNVRLFCNILLSFIYELV